MFALKLAGCFIGLVAALKPIKTIGNSFVQTDAEVVGNNLVFKDSSERFNVKGVSYQPDLTGSMKDTLSSGDQCRRDAFVLQQLGVNTIEVTGMDPEVNHDDCMSVFNAAGIYVMVDLQSESAKFDAAKPEDSYNEKYMEYILSVMTEFHGYPNTMAYVAFTDPIKSDKEAEAASYIRAIIRDIQTYNSRDPSKNPVPVGIIGSDSQYSKELAHYLSCEGEGSIDFFGLQADKIGELGTEKDKGWSTIAYILEKYQNPSILTRIGPGNLKTLFTSTKVNSILSGGVLFPYSSTKADKNGLVEIGDSLKYTKAFDSVKEVLRSVKDSGSSEIKEFDSPQIPSAGTYKSIKISKELPQSKSTNLIAQGIRVYEGALDTPTDLSVKSSILDSAGKTIDNPKVEAVSDVWNPWGDQKVVVKRPPEGNAPPSGEDIPFEKIDFDHFDKTGGYRAKEGS